MSRAILLIALLVAGYLIYKMYFKQLVQQGSSGKLKFVLIGLGIVFLGLALTGRAPAVFAILGAAMMQIMRLAPLLIRFAPFLRRYLGGAGIGGSGLGGSSAGSAPGQSRVKTASLVMSLDHASGRMNGDIIAGQFSGRQLSTLSDSELLTFYRECQQTDHEAVRLLLTYISRERPELSQEQFSEAGGSSPTSNNDISIDDAYDILGLAPGATRQDVIDAHRSLMGRFHPDKGGSNYLATKVNAAKTVLLKTLD